jgi:hypothetical protein
VGLGMWILYGGTARDRKVRIVIFSFKNWDVVPVGVVGVVIILIILSKK